MPWPAWLTWNSLAQLSRQLPDVAQRQPQCAGSELLLRRVQRIATFLDDLVGWITSFFFKLTWVGTAALGTLVVLRFGGRRAALGVVAAFAAFALTGLWESSVQTFSLTIASVSLALAIGLPLGVLAGRSDRFQSFITPVLDAMQIVPAFAYLMPIVILFSVGPGAAVAMTLIYAIPPAIRITALGIRGVPMNTVEAAAGDGLDAASDAHEGADSARAANAAARREPDDPLRAVDGRDRRTDRRPGSR